MILVFKIDKFYQNGKTWFLTIIFKANILVLAVAFYKTSLKQISFNLFMIREVRSSGHIKVWESGFLNWLLFSINHLGMFMVQCRIHAFKHTRFNMKIISLSQNSNCSIIFFHYNKCYTTLHLQNKAQKTWKKFQMFLLIKTNNKTKIFKNLATNFDFLTYLHFYYLTKENMILYLFNL